MSGKRIVFIGAAGCGKSTLATDVFSKLKQQSFNVDMVTEWIRGEINARGPMQSIWEQYRTRNHQKELEDAIPDAVELSIVDSGTLTPYFYSTLYADGKNARERLVLQDMYRYLMDDLYLGRYDLIFYLPRTRGVDTNDGTRFQAENDLDHLDEHMRLVFTRIYKGNNVHVIDEPFGSRCEKVLKIISNNIALTPRKQA
jgi:nicotinamide riboside kinase